MEFVTEAQYLRDMAEVNERITKLNDKVFQLEMLNQQQVSKAQEQEEVMQWATHIIQNSELGAVNEEFGIQNFTDLLLLTQKLYSSLGAFMSK